MRSKRARIGTLVVTSLLISMVAVTFSGFVNASASHLGLQSIGPLLVYRADILVGVRALGNASTPSYLRISGNSSIWNLQYDPLQQIINFTTKGRDGTISLIHLVIARNLINGPPALYIDNGRIQPVEYVWRSNSTSYFIDFAYHESSHTIVVYGSSGANPIASILSHTTNTNNHAAASQNLIAAYQYVVSQTVYITTTSYVTSTSTITTTLTAQPPAQNLIQSTLPSLGSLSPNNPACSYPFNGYLCNEGPPQTIIGYLTTDGSCTFLSVPNSVNYNVANLPANHPTGVVQVYGYVYPDWPQGLPFPPYPFQNTICSGIPIWAIPPYIAPY